MHLLHRAFMRRVLDYLQHRDRSKNQEIRSTEAVIINTTEETQSVRIRRVLASSMKPSFEREMSNPVTQICKM